MDFEEYDQIVSLSAQELIVLTIMVVITLMSMTKRRVVNSTQDNRFRIHDGVDDASTKALRNGKDKAESGWLKNNIKSRID